MPGSFEGNSDEPTVIELTDKGKKSATARPNLRSEPSTHESSNDYIAMARKYRDQREAARAQALANEENLAHTQADIDTLAEANQGLADKVS
jgi:hypothetical protein